jgi:hypothetical protein
MLSGLVSYHPALTKHDGVKRHARGELGEAVFLWRLANFNLGSAQQAGVVGTDRLRSLIGNTPGIFSRLDPPAL